MATGQGGRCGELGYKTILSDVLCLALWPDEFPVRFVAENLWVGVTFILKLLSCFFRFAAGSERRLVLHPGGEGRQREPEDHAHRHRHRPVHLNTRRPTGWTGRKGHLGLGFLGLYLLGFLHRTS